ncbi:MAG: hypothetical protein JNN03_04335 [Rubrivivax sp.]|nr:hypothetical protein [Rubrivivax sp.]
MAEPAGAAGSAAAAGAVGAAGAAARPAGSPAEVIGIGATGVTAGGGAVAGGSANTTKLRDSRGGQPNASATLTIGSSMAWVVVTRRRVSSPLTVSTTVRTRGAGNRRSPTTTSADTHSAAMVSPASVRT